MAYLLFSDFDEVRSVRRATFDNGYRVIAVHSPWSLYAHSPGKQPVKRRGANAEEQNWRLGHDRPQLDYVTATSCNTGICTEGLRVVDVDIDEGERAAP